MKIVFLTRDKYRTNETNALIDALQKAEFEVEVASHRHYQKMLSKKPDIILKWEEHGQLFVTNTWRKYVSNCYQNNIIPLSVDYGYFSHYSQLMLDKYELNNAVSSIHTDWAIIPITLKKPPERLAEYFDKLDKVRDKALNSPRITKDKYVAIFTSWSLSLARPIFKSKNKKEWIKNVCDMVRKHGYTPVVKVTPLAGGPEPPEDVMRIEGTDLEKNANIMLHAHNNIILSSSVSNEMVLHNAPLTALGRSWFTGLGVFYEPNTWEDIVEPHRINVNMRNRWKNWWFTRQGSPEWIVANVLPKLIMEKKDASTERTLPRRKKHRR